MGGWGGGTGFLRIDYDPHTQAVSKREGRRERGEREREEREREKESERGKEREEADAGPMARTGIWPRHVWSRLIEAVTRSRSR